MASAKKKSVPSKSKIVRRSSSPRSSSVSSEKKAWMPVIIIAIAAILGWLFGSFILAGRI